jgi:phage terminase small subunit
LTRPPGVQHTICHWHHSAIPLSAFTFTGCPLARQQLRAKQQRFIDEYLVDLNATQAAIRAGYPRKTAGIIGFENLKKPNIAAAIQRAMDARAKRTEITADRVLREIACLGYSNVMHYHVDGSNNLVLSPDAPPEAMRAVSSIKRKTRIIPQKQGEPIVEHEIEFRLWDKNTALTNLGKHLKLFTDRLELIGPVVDEIKRKAEEYGMTVDDVIAEATAIAEGRS